jgi:hypothetical protein
MKKLDELFPNGLWRMSGSEESFEYTVRGVSSRGRVGVRFLPNGNVRIRLEPAPSIGATVIAKWRKTLPREVGYKQPGDSNQPRFSIVVGAGEHADAILANMFDLLGQKDGLSSFTLNPDMNAPASTLEPLAA